MDLPSDSRSDDPYLLARVAENDQAALEILFERYARVLTALVFRILGSIEESEEVVLDVFSEVWRNAGQYNSSRGRVDAWLFMITRSRALDRLRKLKRADQAKNAYTQEAAIDITVKVYDPQEDLVIQERRLRVLSALEQLPLAQRQILELAYYRGLTHVEIASLTGQALGTVKTRIRLGLNRLRGTLSSLS